jgi:hypothetical protein
MSCPSETSVFHLSFAGITLPGNCTGILPVISWLPANFFSPPSWLNKPQD